MRLISFLLLFPLLAACTFSAPQFESGVRFIDSISMAERRSEEPAQSKWLASVGDEGAVVMPYSSEGLIVFANADGDAIAFDGWLIMSIIGFGQQGVVSIADNQGDRRILVDGFEAQDQCGQWLLIDTYWIQECLHGEGQIELDEKGNIVRISQWVGSGIGRVTLTVAP